MRKRHLAALVVIASIVHPAWAANLSGHSCAGLGTTQLADDKSSIVACLKVNEISETLKWKSMTPFDFSTTGYAGIGTAAPVDKLHVAGGNLRVGEINQAGVGVLPNYGRFLLFSGGPGTPSYGSENSDFMWMARYNVAKDVTELRLNIGDNTVGSHADSFVVGSHWHSNGVWYPALTVRADGNVGIGTVVPQVNFHLVGGFHTIARVESAAADSSAGIDFKNDAQRWAVQIRGDDEDIFAIRDENLNINRLSIDTSGNVGIGTSSPQATLDVNGILQISREGVNGRLYGHYPSSTNWPGKELVLTLANGQGTDDDGIWIGPNTAGAAGGKGWVRLHANRIAMTGSNLNVGIKTVNPAYTLHVNGSVAGVGPYNDLSDERVKKDIVTIANGLDLVEKLRGVRFNWRTVEERKIGKELDLPVNEPQVGLIAQEVEKVLPEAVTTAKDGVKSVQEARIVPLLVEAVKALKAANDKNAAENKELRQRLEQLEKSAK